MNASKTVPPSAPDRPARRERRTFCSRPTNFRLAPGVRHRAESYRDCYAGKKDDLISSGLVTADMFPGEPGLPTTQVTFNFEGAEWPERLVIAASTSGRFVVSVWLTRAETDRRYSEVTAKEGERREREAADDEALQTLRDVELQAKNAPKSADEFRKCVAADLWYAYTYALHRYKLPDHALACHGGFDLPAATWDRLHSLMSEAFHLLKWAAPTYSEARRLAPLTKARAPLAQRDAQLQAFLTAAKAGASAA